MSLPWRDPLAVWIAPAEVTLVERNFGLRGFGQHARTLRPEPAPPHTPAWRPAVEALSRSLEAAPMRAGRARVVVSDHFVRYVIARWREDLRSPAERQAFIHHSFRETYGPAVEGWTLREDHESHGRASLACAIDSALLEALREIFRRARMRVASVQPLFMSAFNRHRRAMGADGGFFVYESRRLCGACFGGEEWLSISNVRVDGPDALAAAIDRELVLHGLPAEAPVYLCIADGSAPPEGLARPVKLVERSFNWADSPALGEERVA